LAKIGNQAKERLVYVDESGIDRYLHNPWGYAVRGKQVYEEISGKRYDRESFIAAKVGSAIIAPMCFKGTCNTELFSSWLKEKC
jgi:hypothetical protein